MKLLSIGGVVLGVSGVIVSGYLLPSSVHYESSPDQTVAAIFAYTSNPPFTKTRAEVLFVGDMMFDRHIRRIANEKGGELLFSCVSEMFAESDLVVGNLEGPITEEPSVSMGSAEGAPDNFVFTFPPETASLLAKHNVRMVSLANNHILNFGTRGVFDTEEFLNRAGVDFFGDPVIHRVGRVAIEGVPLAFIGFSEFGGYASERVREDIVRTRTQGYLPVVFAHWGDEYEKTPERVRTLARSFVDAGAEFVVGAHPHVVQGHEIYQKKYIYYSLGNFIFDQYFEPAVMEGLVLRVSFGRHGVVSISEVPVRISPTGTVCPVTEE